MPLVVPEAAAERYKEQMKAPGLVFVTRDNGEHILDKAAQQTCTHSWIPKTFVPDDPTEMPVRELLCGKCGLIDRGDDAAGETT